MTEHHIKQVYKSDILKCDLRMPLTQRSSSPLERFIKAEMPGRTSTIHFRNTNLYFGGHTIPLYQTIKTNYCGVHHSLKICLLDMDWVTVMAYWSITLTRCNMPSKISCLFCFSGRFDDITSPLNIYFTNVVEQRTFITTR